MRSKIKCLHTYLMTYNFYHTMAEGHAEWRCWHSVSSPTFPTKYCHGFRRHTAEDQEYQVLKKDHPEQFPKSESLSERAIEEIWSVKDNFSINDSLIVYSCCLYISHIVSMLSQLHEAHQGLPILSMSLPHYLLVMETLKILWKDAGIAKTICH